jgi:hypothetical protein
MLSALIANSFVVFGITLVLTKSKILAGKREFVEKRYQASKVDGHPSWIHLWWHAMWTCPMCSGFWIALLVALFLGPCLIYGTMFAFGANWLLHCLENVLFGAGEFFDPKENSEKI